MNQEESILRMLKGTAIVLPGDDVDTDRIIPARFLRCVTFDALGAYAFYDERYDANGNLRSHPLNGSTSTDGSILFVGRNFGCGSSREHAPQALMRHGIKAIVGISFADIFAGNCIAIGVPTMRLGLQDWNTMTGHIAKDPSLSVEMNIEAKTISAGTLKMQAIMEDSAQCAFLQGLWDTNGMLWAQREQIAKTAQRLPYMQSFAV